jgi:hypothetical protein
MENIVCRLDPNGHNAGKPSQLMPIGMATLRLPAQYVRRFSLLLLSNDLGRIGLRCPGCGKSTALVTGSAAKGGEARIEWEFD